MAKDDFYIINTWMIEDLNLSGVELQCFAIIWSLSRAEKQMYIAGNSHLVKMTKKTEPTIISALKKLCDKGYIKKVPVVVNNIERNYYKAITQGTKEFLVGGLKNLSGGTKKILAPNNKEIKKDNNKKEENNKLSSSKKVDIDFDNFYKLYPLKKSKQCAIKVWNRLSVEDKKQAIDKLPAYIADCYENKRSFKYPSTYLSQRTWEDDFISSDEKEEPTEETQYPDGMDAEQWNEITFWMCNKIPNIAGKISPETFDKMKQMAKDSQLLSIILKEVNYRFTLDNALDVMEIFKEELKNYWDEQTD